MPYQNILVERDDRVGIITVNRPQVLNALNDATIHELDAAFDELGEDVNVRVIVITGAGDRAFVAGADINELRAITTAEGAMRKMGEGQALMRKIEKLNKPVIAAINGFALGGGTEIALAADIRIASDGAKMGLPEINLGLYPGYGGTQRLPRLVGKSMAKWLIFTGDHIGADEAFRIGLVDKVVPAGDLMQYTMDFAKKLATKAPIAMSMAKKVINEGVEVDIDRAMSIELGYSAIVNMTEDRLEGTSAFLEKRKPEWKGR